MRSYILLLIVVLSGCNNVSTKSFEAKGKSQIEFETEIYNFGDVKYGEIVGATLYYVNKGESPLIINSVETGCSCTTVKYDEKPLPEGGRAGIKLIFDSSGMHGRQLKTITVHSNSVENRNFQLTFEANVIVE